MNKIVTNKKEQRGFLGVLLFLCPIAALPLIFREIYEKRYYALTYLALFMALLSYLWTPSGDLYRFYLDYYKLRGISFSSFIDYSNTQFDVIIQFIIWLFGKTSINFEWVRFFICFFCYSIVFGVTIKIIENTSFGQSKKTSFMVFFTMFGILGLTVFLTGARFNVASAFYIYSVYYMFFEPRHKGWYALFITPFIHYSFIPVVILSVMAKLTKPHLKKANFLALIILSYAVSTFLMIYFIDMLSLGDALMDHLENYTTGYYAGDELKDHSFLFRISQIIGVMSFYIYIVISLIRLRDYKCYSNFAFLVIFTILLWHMNTAFNRYAGISIRAFTPLFLLNVISVFKYKDLKLMFFVALFVFTASIYQNKREISHGAQYLIATPVPVILNHTYSEQWINKNITIRGDFEYE